MYNYVLYLSFAGEISDDSDLYSLAQNATYFVIEPNDGRLFNEGMVDEMPVFRKEWEEIVIKNKPYEYKTDATNKNKLYDLIIDNPTTYTYFLKFVNGSEIRYGYFGEVDCSINEDRSLIRVLPSIIDQYTDFIENYETDVDVFGATNLIRNGNFSVWNGSDPAFWVNGVLGGAVQDTLLSQPCAKLGRGLIFGTSVGQAVTGVNVGKQALIEFNYAFTGDDEILRDLKYSLTLTGTKTYQLQSDGQWVESGTVNKITYKNNAYPLPEESVEEFEHYQILTNALPETGALLITFYNDDAIGDFIFLTNVQINSSALSYIDISLTFPTDYLTVKPQEEIIKVIDNYYPDFIAAGIKSNDIDESTINNYFNGDGSPNMTFLADSKWGVVDYYGAKYPDWKTIFETDPNSTFYKGEICELTIWIGNEYNWIPKRRNIHGYAKFAREEVYIVDAYDGLNNLIPPEENVGWVFTSKLENGLRLWVRQPFNGAFSGSNETWTLGDVQEWTAGSEFWRKLTSVKVYPTSENSTSIGVGLNFRDICRKIYRSTHNSRMGKEVYSAFFWNDSPYMDFLDLDGNLNYYTMKENFLNNIAVIHTSEIKNISNPELSDSELKVSFKGLFDDLLVKFPALVWFVDTNMNLHFEHTRFIHRIRSYVDITGSSIPKLGEYKSYKFDSSKLFGNIVREDINSYYKDFKKSEETFKKITTNKRRKDKKETKRTAFISTDIMGAIENSGDLANGMVLVAYFVNDEGNNEMVYGTGQITGNDKPNGVLATSYLLKTFGNYIGTWHDGFIDGQAIAYRFSQYCRLGSEITLKGIVQQNYLFTDIGMALIQSKKYDYEKEVTICTPVYRHIDWYVVAENNDELLFDYEYLDFLEN